jgi:hypothetical protein
LWNIRRWPSKEVASDHTQALLQTFVGQIRSAELRLGPVTGFTRRRDRLDAELLSGCRVQREDENVLGPAFGSVLPILAASPDGRSNVSPTRGTIASPLETLRIDEGLDEKRLVPVSIVPIGWQPRQALGQHMRREIRNLERQQEAAIGDHRLQIPSTR